MGAIALGFLGSFGWTVHYFTDKRSKKIGAEEKAIEDKLKEIEKFKQKIEHMGMDITLSDEQKRERIIYTQELLKEAIEEYNDLCENISE